MINQLQPIKITGSYLEWEQLNKALWDITISNSFPIPNVNLYYLFMSNIYFEVIKKLHSKIMAKSMEALKNPEFKIKFTIPELTVIMVCIQINTEDSTELRRIISRIDQMLPVEIAQHIRKFLN
jgi:hypothetical protein